MERQLLAAAERATRRPRDRVALVLHLSGLYPPDSQRGGPRPHHLRIARALMHDVAERQDGQTYALRNGDVVLLCQSGAASAPLADLPATLARLFQRDAAGAASLVSVWPLTQEAERLLAYATARLTDSETIPTADDAPPVPDMVTTLDAAIARTWPSDLIHRQTAVLLAAPGGGKVGIVGGSGGRDDRVGVTGQMQPLFQELSFSIALVEARLDAAGEIGRDPFLLRHLAGRLDARMLATLSRQGGRGGPLDPGDGAKLPLHLNMTLRGLLSDAFVAVVALCRDAGRTLAAEITLMEVGADPAGFARTRTRAAELGVALVLDGVSHQALLLACPWKLRVDQLKLDWSPRLAELPVPEQTALAEALRQIDPASIVLHRAETETAIRWGVSHGIRRFQGRHIDAMLAAGRIISCPISSACSLRQCTERATATGGAGRSACGNLALLDASAPPPGRAERPA